MSQSNLLKNTTIYALGDIFPRAVNFLFFPILTRYLTPADYGILNYVMSINNFLTIITFLCLNTYYMVYYNKMENDIEREKLLGNISIFVVAINIILCVIIFTFGDGLFGLFGDNVPFYPYIAIGILTNFFNVFSVLPSCLLRMQERPSVFTALNVTKSTLVTLMTVALVIVFDKGVIGALNAQLYITAVFAVIFSYITFKHAIFKINWGQIRAALIFSLPLVPGSVSYYFVSLSDRLFINKYLSLTDLGLYSTASSLALVLNTISYGAYKAFEPYVFKISDDTGFNEKVEKLFKNYFYTLLLFSICISLFSPEFLQIFTVPKYYPAAHYVAPLVFSTLLSSLGYLFSTVVTSLGRTFQNSLISIVGGCVSVVLNVCLLRYGVIFACVSSITSMFVMFCMNIYYSDVRFSAWKYIWVFCVMALVVVVFEIISLDSLVLSVSIKATVVVLIGWILYNKSDITIKSLKNDK